MLPIRWIVPIVGALFALALIPLAFNAQDKSGSLRNAGVTFNERSEHRQTIVPLGVQRNDDELKSSRDLAAVPADVTGSVEATSPVAATPVIRTPARRIRHAGRPPRAVVHKRAKHALAANIFGGQRAWRISKPEFRFNAN